MKGVKEAFIDAGEISQMLGIGMTKASQVHRMCKRQANILLCVPDSLLVRNKGR